MCAWNCYTPFRGLSGFFVSIISFSLCNIEIGLHEVSSFGGLPGLAIIITSATFQRAGTCLSRNAEFIILVNNL